MTIADEFLTTLDTVITTTNTGMTVLWDKKETTRPYRWFLNSCFECFRHAEASGLALSAFGFRELARSRFLRLSYFDEVCCFNDV